MDLIEDWRNAQHDKKFFDGKYACYKHFEDRNLKNFIIENSDQGTCSYCKRKTSVMKIPELAEYIEKMLEFEFDDPYSRGAPYNKHANYYEDRFYGLNVSDSMDLLQDILEVDCFEIIEDISQDFGNSFWCEIDSIFWTVS